MPRFWVYIENKVSGPVDIPSLRKISGFNLYTQVCPEGQTVWRIADEIIEIKSYFATPPRVSQLLTEGPSASEGSAVKAQPVSLPQEKTPVLEVIEPSASPEKAEALNAEVPALQSLVGNEAFAPKMAPTLPGSEANKASLRIPCVMCAYKNPRDAKVCMKCGSPLEVEMPLDTSETIAPEKQNTEKNPATATISIPSPRSPLPPLEPPSTTSSLNPMVEIPIVKIAAWIGVVALFVGFAIGGQLLWKKHHVKKVSAPSLTPPASTRPGTSTLPKTRAIRRTGRRTKSRSLVQALPGIQSGESSRQTSPTRSGPHHRAIPQEQPLETHSSATSARTAPYEVLDQAAPQKHRVPAPQDSTYAVKRRSDKTLWGEKQLKAIQLTQQQRIYGGQRTILRNTEILMQILRDREYASAFEKGKRLYFYDDMDWGAVQKEGPVYEVQLTLSGGRDEDGTPRQALKFAFNTDLEQGTVEPGGSGSLKANTLRGFFDESRIPPEDRSDIAKDVEELVLAAQPGASPLALQTVVRHFVATYSQPALTRVTSAYNLLHVQKMLDHELRAPEKPSETRTNIPEKTILREDIPSKPNTKPVKMVNLSGGSVQYAIERLEGKERRVTLKAQSQTTPGKLWETLTNYDHYTQFLPDVLISQKEGQDGPAVVIHTVSLTRFLFFVFKINVHMRIIEHPMERTLEFERIAGDFNSLKGSAVISVDSANPQMSQITFNTTFAPHGFLPDCVVRSMTQRFLKPLFESLIARAQSI